MLTRDDIRSIESILRMSELMPFGGRRELEILRKRLVVCFGEIGRSRQVRIRELLAGCRTCGCPVDHTNPIARDTPFLCSRSNQ